MEKLIEAISGRRAQRAFARREVPEEEQQLLWRAVSVAPSHGNVQSVRLLVARSSAALKSIAAALSDGNRHWAAKAPLLVALGALPEHEHTDSYGEERALWSFHSGIAAGNLMAQATSLGLIAHPMAGFEEATLRNAFGAPEEFRILVVFAIGYPGPIESLPEDLQRREESKQKRQPLNRLVAIDRWQKQNEFPARNTSQSQQDSGKLES
ncbi:MAG: nitroreductase [Dehalococcoidia bacterium]|nr:nitroreductase [Dehalococcoidia bacterium]